MKKIIINLLIVAVCFYIWHLLFNDRVSRHTDCIPEQRLALSQILDLYGNQTDRKDNAPYLDYEVSIQPITEDEEIYLLGVDGYIFLGKRDMHSSKIKDVEEMVIISDNVTQFQYSKLTQFFNGIERLFALELKYKAYILLANFLTKDMTKQLTTGSCYKTG